MTTDGQPLPTARLARAATSRPARRSIRSVEMARELRGRDALQR